MHYSTLPQALDELSGLDRRIRFMNRGGEESTTDFARLRCRALNLLRHFQDRGLEAGDEMLLVLGRNDAFVDAYWACLYGGIVPVPLAPGVSEEQRRKIFRVAAALDRPHLFTEQVLAERMAAFSAQHGMEQAHTRLASRTVLTGDVPAKDREGEPVSRAPHDAAFIQFSSGSTSDPKGVVLSHRNLLANIRDMIRTAKLTDRDRGLSWMPLTHDMGLIGFHLMMLLAGMEHTIIATEAFIRRPMRWIRAASDHRATVLCSPNFGFRYLLKAFAPDKAGDIDLSPVRIIFNGAEPISAPLCEEFLDTLEPFGLVRTAMYPVYGLAEASLAVSFPPVGDPYRSLTVSRNHLGYGDRIDLDDRDSTVTLVNVGRAIGECELRIGDDSGNDLGPDTVGRILIRGANVTHGFYAPGGTLNREAFRRGGWLDTGDLGFTHDGDLYITGRTKDVIFVNGQNYYAHDIEAVAAEVDGVELGKVVAAGSGNESTGLDELVLFVLHRGELPDFQPIAVRVAAAVTERTGAEVHAVVPVNNIPKTTSGKLRRFTLGEAYERGEFEGLAVRPFGVPPGGIEPAGRDAVGPEAFLVRLCNDVLDGLHVEADDNLFDIGVGSLKIIELHERIEEHYPGRIEAGDLLEYPTLAKLAARLDSRPR